MNANKKNKVFIQGDDCMCGQAGHFYDAVLWADRKNRRQICTCTGSVNILIRCMDASCVGHVLPDVYFHREDRDLVSDSIEPVRLVMTECKHVPEDVSKLVDLNKNEMREFVCITESGLRKESDFEKKARALFAASFAPKPSAAEAAAPVKAKAKAKKAEKEEKVPVKAKAGRGRPRGGGGVKECVDADSNITEFEGVFALSEIDPKLIKMLADKCSKLGIDADKLGEVYGQHTINIDIDSDYFIHETAHGEPITLKTVLAVAKGGKLTVKEIRELLTVKGKKKKTNRLNVQGGHFNYAPTGISARLTTIKDLGEALATYESLHNDAVECKRAAPKVGDERPQFELIKKRAFAAYQALNQIKGEADAVRKDGRRGLILCLNTAVHYSMFFEIFLEFILDLLMPHFASRPNDQDLKKFKTRLIQTINQKRELSLYICTRFAMSTDFSKVVEISEAVELRYTQYHTICSSAMVSNASSFKNQKEQRECVKNIDADLAHMIPLAMEQINDEFAKARPDWEPIAWTDSAGMRKILIQTFMDMAVRRVKAKNVAAMMNELGLPEAAAAHLTQHMLTGEIADESARATSIIQMVQNTHIPIANETERDYARRRVARVAGRGTSIERSAVDARASETMTKSKAKKQKPSEDSDSEDEVKFTEDELKAADADETETEDEESEIEEDDDDDKSYETDDDVVHNAVAGNAAAMEMMVDVHEENQNVVQFTKRAAVARKRGSKRKAAVQEEDEDEEEEEEDVPVEPSAQKKRKGDTGDPVAAPAFNEFEDAPLVDVPDAEF